MKKLIRFTMVAGFIVMLATWTVAQDAPPTPQPALPTAPKKKGPPPPHLALPEQQTTTEIPVDQQPSKEQIDELMDVMGVDDDVASMMTLLPAMMEQQAHAEIAAYLVKLPSGATPTAAQRAEIEKLTKKYVENAANVYPASEMIADLTLLYQHHLNNNDVESLLLFFGSDAGQHLLEVRPEIMKEYRPIVTAHIDERSKAINAEFKKDLDQVFASSKSAKK